MSATRGARLAWIAWIAAAIVLVAVVAAYFRQGSNARGPAGMAGQPAPTYALVDSAGRRTAPSDYRGRVVLVNLWASWCPPCRAEMPDLERLYRAKRDRGLVVLGVNEGESRARASEFARSLGIDFPVLLDADQYYGRTYSALGLPTTIVIGRDGTIVNGYDGALTFAQMQSAVAALLAR